MTQRQPRTAFYTATIQRFAEDHADEPDSTEGAQQLARQFSLPVHHVIRDVLNAYMEHKGAAAFGGRDLAEVWQAATQSTGPVRPPFTTTKTR